MAQAPSGVQHWTEISWQPHVQNALIGGRRLRYLDYGNGPPLILIHGLGGSWQTWLENIPRLAREHRVIAVDLPGFGHSEPLTSGFEMSAFADAVDGLLKRLGIKDATIVGHSMGGIVTCGMAVTHPERVAKIVIVNGGGAPLSPARLAMIVQSFTAANRLFMRPGIMWSVARRTRLRHAIIGGFVTNPKSLSPELAAELIPLMAAPGFIDAVSAAGKEATKIDPSQIRVPTLLLWGDNDRIVPLAATKEMLGQLPDGCLHVLENVGHCPMFECPDEFNQALLDFTSARGRTTAHTQ